MLREGVRFFVTGIIVYVTDLPPVIIRNLFPLPTILGFVVQKMQNSFSLISLNFITVLHLYSIYISRRNIVIIR